MKVFIVLAGLLAFVASQRPYSDEIPIPYSFRYLAEGEEGTSSHEETSDGSGRKVGSYSFTDLEGNNRVVEYTADDDGFNAVVRTNEPGTANQNPANVIMESSAPGADTGGVFYSGTPQQPRPQPRPVSPPRPVSGSTGGRHPGGGVAYVLVPVSEAGIY